MEEKNAKARLFDTFVDMLQTMDFSRITVSELCRRAELNRASFYHNYLDVYDLGEAVMQLWEEESIRIVYSSDYTQGKRLFYLNYFTYANEHRKLFKAVLKLRQITEFDSLTNPKRIDNIDRIVNTVFHGENVDYLLAYNGGAIHGVEQLWVERDFQETPEELWRIFLAHGGNNPDTENE